MNCYHSILDLVPGSKAIVWKNQVIKPKNNILFHSLPFLSVLLAIESILHQKVKPDALLLWLYKGEFEGKYCLPKRLLDLEKRGLQIRFCDDNLMPHKKLHNA